MLTKRVLKQSVSLLNADYVKLDTKWNYQNVLSPYHRIYYIDDGNGQLEDTEKTVSLQAGFLYIIPSYTLCNLICENFLSQYFVQFFEESGDGTSLFGDAHFVDKVAAREIDVLNFQRLIEINPGRGFNRSDDPRIYEKYNYYKQYQALNDLQSHADFIETQGILLQLVSRFSMPEQYAKKNKELPFKIMEATRFISLNLHQELSVQFLADRFNYNTQYFSRLFEQHLGIRPQAYVIQQRIERAKHMISAGKFSFSEIAERTGFGSLRSFSRTFKYATGFSPRQYKRTC